jgi:hypothetical protein
VRQPGWMRLAPSITPEQVAEIDERVLPLLRKHRPCEASGHPERHPPAGPAEWMQYGICPACEMSTPPIPVCEGGRIYKEGLQHIQHTSSGGCGKISRREEWLLVFEPIYRSGS